MTVPTSPPPTIRPGVRDIDLLEVNAGRVILCLVGAGVAVSDIVSNAAGYPPFALR
jgi:hypothetical protein